VLTTDIVVESPPYFVWAYFIQPDNWRKWSRLTLESAHWETGGHLYFEKNMTSTIDAITPGTSVSFGDSWSQETWEFEPTPNGHTLVRVSEEPRAVKYTDHGKAALAKTHAALERFKAAIEAATEDLRSSPASESV